MLCTHVCAFIELIFTTFDIKLLFLIIVNQTCYYGDESAYNEQDTDASHTRNNAITESGVIKSQENLHLTQKGLTAKSRRELRAKRKQAAAEAEQRELDLAVANLFAWPIA